MKDHRIAKQRFPRTTNAQRTRWVEKYFQSGLTQAGFAAKHGIGHSTLAKWINESRNASIAAEPSQQLVEVSMPFAAGSNWAAEITLKDGTILRLRGDIAAALLQKFQSDGLCSR